VPSSRWIISESTIFGRVLTSMLNPPQKAAWEMVCLSKSEGGLGVLKLQTQNEALLLKNLHKFFNRLDIPWVHLIWEKYYNDGSPPSSRKKAHSGGVIILSSWSPLKEWHM